MEKIVVKVDSEIKELIPGFIENRHQDIDILRTFVVKEDFKSIKILGHSMKGFGAGYGFYEISDIGKLLEKYADQRDVREIINLIDKLVEYLRRIEIVYV